MDYIFKDVQQTSLVKRNTANNGKWEMFRSNHKTTTNNRKSIATGYGDDFSGHTEGLV